MEREELVELSTKFVNKNLEIILNGSIKGKIEIADAKLGIEYETFKIIDGIDKKNLSFNINQIYKVVESREEGTSLYLDNDIVIKLIDKN